MCTTAALSLLHIMQTEASTYIKWGTMCNGSRHFWIREGQMGSSGPCPIVLCSPCTTAVHCRMATQALLTAAALQAPQRGDMKARATTRLSLLALQLALALLEGIVSLHSFRQLLQGLLFCLIPIPFGQQLAQRLLYMRSFHILPAISHTVVIAANTRGLHLAIRHPHLIFFCYVSLSFMNS